jgi:hypothetical protein
MTWAEIPTLGNSTEKIPTLVKIEGTFFKPLKNVPTLGSTGPRMRIRTNK